MSGEAIARLTDDAQAHNTLNVRTIEVFFQKSAGVDEGESRGISGLEYRVTVDGVQTQTGTTGDDGLVPVSVRPGTQTVLELLWQGSTVAQYQVAPKDDALEADSTLIGLQRRFRTLGYQLGAAGDTQDGVDGTMGLHTDKAIQDFQIDAGLAFDSIAGDGTRRELNDAVGGERPAMIHVNAIDEWRIVVPLRFTRAVSGQAVADAPDVDDRGYHMGNRPSAWGRTTIRGPMFGVMVGHTVRVRLAREDIDDTAPLFVTSSDTAKLTVQEANGGPVGPDGVFHVRGVEHGGNTATHLDVHLGSATGPILAQADVRVFAPLHIPVTPHYVRIDTNSTVGSTPVFDDVDLRTVMTRVQAIWNPSGVVFRTAASHAEHITLPSNTLNTANVRTYEDAGHILGLQRTRLRLAAGAHDTTLNLYVVQTMVNPEFRGTQMGLGVSRQTADENSITDTGILIAADALDQEHGEQLLARLIAHEIGHFFRLRHVQGRDSDNPVQDTFGRRQLMYPFVNLFGGTGGTALPRFDNVGYGNASQGCLITMKNHAHHSTDGETFTARTTIQGDNWH